MNMILVQRLQNNTKLIRVLYYTPQEIAKYISTKKNYFIIFF
jgi:hypothetical protein